MLAAVGCVSGLDVHIFPLAQHTCSAVGTGTRKGLDAVSLWSSVLILLSLHPQSVVLEDRGQETVVQLNFLIFKGLLTQTDTYYWAAQGF